MKVLITCPPMLRAKDEFEPLMRARGLEPVCPDVTQTLSEDELIDLLPTVDGWIIGDDPATLQVLKAGIDGRLKAAVKWGAGVDNVDFEAFRELHIPITNTPGMFGNEVADIALCYSLMLARPVLQIDKSVREGRWEKLPGISMAGKTAGIVGLGDIGLQTSRRMRSIGMRVIGWDPAVSQLADTDIEVAEWPGRIAECDFIIFTCALNASNQHMYNHHTIALSKDGVRVVNVARGGLIDETAVQMGLASGKIHSAALDVFEVEPLPERSPLREHPLCIFGTHNSSNTHEAVYRTSVRAIDLLADFLKGSNA